MFNLACRIVHLLFCYFPGMLWSQIYLKMLSINNQKLYFNKSRIIYRCSFKDTIKRKHQMHYPVQSKLQVISCQFDMCVEFYIFLPNAGKKQKAFVSMAPLITSISGKMLKMSNELPIAGNTSVNNSDRKSQIDGKSHDLNINIRADLKINICFSIKIDFLKFILPEKCSKFWHKIRKH